MSASRQATRPLQACIRCSRTPASLQARTFTSSAAAGEEVQVQKPAEPSTPPPSSPSPSSSSTEAPKLDPNTVLRPSDEKKLIKSGIYPIGSRRRRAAVARSPGVPFETLPFQCFQEARKVLKQDREEKLAAIERERARIARLEAQDAAVSGGEREKKVRLMSMQNQLEELKLLADINDPLVKKNFEDGKANYAKPIYRLLAERKWREYKLKIVNQRIQQMYVIPDVLPAIEQKVDVSIAFGDSKVQPGAMVASEISEIPAKLTVQAFNRGERLVSIVVINSDVPNVEKDGFDYRCHYAAVNIPLSPTKPTVRLEKLSADSQVVLPWLPPYAQQGSPYQRYTVWILEQPEGKTLNIAKMRGRCQRDGFILRSFVDRYELTPVGVNMFRALWDDNTAAVMERAGIPGADVLFKRMKPEKLPYKKKDGARYR